MTTTTITTSTAISTATTEACVRSRRTKLPSCTFRTSANPWRALTRRAFSRWLTASRRIGFVFLSGGGRLGERKTGGRPRRLRRLRRRLLDGLYRHRCRRISKIE